MLVISSPWRVGYDPIFGTGTDKCKVTVIWCAWSGTLRWKGRKDESWWIVNHKGWAQTDTVPPASVCQGLWSTHQEGLRWDRDCLAMSCQWRFVALHETWYTCLLGMIWSLIFARKVGCHAMPIRCNATNKQDIFGINLPEYGSLDSQLLQSERILREFGEM